MSQWYILNKDHTTTKVGMFDYFTWRHNKNLCRVAKDKVGEAEVSTVFFRIGSFLWRVI